MSDDSDTMTNKRSIMSKKGNPCTVPWIVDVLIEFPTGREGAKKHAYQSRAYEGVFGLHP
jgi:hypothetical protein